MHKLVDIFDVYVVFEGKFVLIWWTLLMIVRVTIQLLNSSFCQYSAKGPRCGSWLGLYGCVGFVGFQFCSIRRRGSSLQFPFSTGWFFLLSMHDQFQTVFIHPQQRSSAYHSTNRMLETAGSVVASSGRRRGWRARRWLSPSPWTNACLQRHCYSPSAHSESLSFSSGSPWFGSLKDSKTRLRWCWSTLTSSTERSACSSASHSSYGHASWPSCVFGWIESVLLAPWQERAWCNCSPAAASQLAKSCRPAFVVAVRHLLAYFYLKCQTSWVLCSLLSRCRCAWQGCRGLVCHPYPAISWWTSASSGFWRIPTSYASTDSRTARLSLSGAVSNSAWSSGQMDSNHSARYRHTLPYQIPPFQSQFRQFFGDFSRQAASERYVLRQTVGHFSAQRSSLPNLHWSFHPPRPLKFPVSIVSRGRPSSWYHSRSVCLEYCFSVRCLLSQARCWKARMASDLEKVVASRSSLPEKSLWTFPLLTTLQRLDPFMPLLICIALQFLRSFLLD